MTSNPQPSEFSRLELELAMSERVGHGLPPQGPLTQEQARDEAAYDQYLWEQEREEEMRIASGGRRLCPDCNRRSLRVRTVATLGGGLPGSEYSELYECEIPSCGHRSL